MDETNKLFPGQLRNLDNKSITYYLLNEYGHGHAWTVHRERCTLYIYRRKSVDHPATNCASSSIEQGDFLDFLNVLYWTLLLLPLLKCHCVGGCWDRNKKFLEVLNSSMSCTSVEQKKTRLGGFQVIAVQIQIQTGPEDHLNEFVPWIFLYTFPSSLISMS